MTFSGPYNSPLALGARPWGSLFFSFWAIFLISPAVLGLMMIVDPAFTELAMQSETIEGFRANWSLTMLGYVATLFLTMIWAESIGAGPFGGSMRANTNWLLVGLIGGPLVLNVTGILVSLVMSGGDPNWQLNDTADPRVFSTEATAGFAFLFAVVFLAPILEEIGYRGIGLGCLLSRGWDAWGAAFVVTILFTLMHTHYTPAALIPIFLTGLFFAWLRIQSGAVSPSIVAHIAANTSIFIQ